MNIQRHKVACPYCGQTLEVSMCIDDGETVSSTIVRHCLRCEQPFAVRLVQRPIVETCALFDCKPVEPPEPAQSAERTKGDIVLAPDWNTAPDWAQWWAVDKSGSAFWYEGEPQSDDMQWWCGEAIRLERDFPCSNWRSTLRQRPKAARA